jgi:hypothetical protein
LNFSFGFNGRIWRRFQGVSGVSKAVMLEFVVWHDGERK